MKYCTECNSPVNNSLLCNCGFNIATKEYESISINEHFVLLNTRTSHKRHESMVVYALHYALRDLELRSQYRVNLGDKYYQIDLYSPALNIAIEIDEPYHDNQVTQDEKRESEIRKELGCQFFRINTKSPIYKQVEIFQI